MQIGVHGSPDYTVKVSNSGSVLTTGTIADLGVDQIGLFKVNKNGVGLTATSAPSVQNTPVFQLAQGKARYAATDAPGTHSSQAPWLTQKIKGSHIKNWEGVKANNTNSTQIWALGYDGVDASKRLATPFDHRDLKVSLHLHGNPIKRLTGVKDHLVREYYIDKGCYESCIDGDCGFVADEKIADSLISQINADSFGTAFNKISRFVKATKVKKCNPAEDALTGLIEFTKYSVTITDEGTNSDLGVVQSQYQGFKVEKDSRSGINTTYTVWKPTSSGAPAAVSITKPISLAVCDVCPSGYTLTAAQNVIQVQRSLAGTENLTDANARQTYANSIKNAYFAPKTFNGATAVDPATDQITLTAHGLTVGQSLVYSNGGGTTIVGLTDGNTYYVKTVVNANNITLSATKNGAVVDITADGVGAAHTLTTASTATFLSTNGSSAQVLIYVDSLANGVTSLNSDLISELSDSSQYCTPPAATTAAWTAGDTANKAPKQYMLTLADTICGNNRLTELQAAYNDLVVSLEGAAGNCATMYLATTYSQPVEPGCYPDSYIYDAPQRYLAQTDWVEYVDPLAVPNCDVTPEEGECCAVGVIFETASFYNNYSNCLYGYYDFDPSDVDPVYMTISIGSLDVNSEFCTRKDIPITKLQGVSFWRGHGEWVKAVEANSRMKESGLPYSSNEGFNSAYGISDFTTKSDIFYDEYKLTVQHDRSNNSIVGAMGDTFDETYAFYFPTGKGKQFESLINGYVASIPNTELKSVVL